MLKQQLDAQGKAVDTIIGNMRVLEGKLAEAKMKKDTLKARAQSAKSARYINDVVRPSPPRGLFSFCNFSKPTCF